MKVAYSTDRDLAEAFAPEPVSPFGTSLDTRAPHTSNAKPSGALSLLTQVARNGGGEGATFDKVFAQGATAGSKIGSVEDWKNGATAEKSPGGRDVTASEERDLIDYFRVKGIPARIPAEGYGRTTYYEADKASPRSLDNSAFIIDAMRRSLAAQDPVILTKNDFEAAHLLSNDGDQKIQLWLGDVVIVAQRDEADNLKVYGIRNNLRVPVDKSAMPLVRQTLARLGVNLSPKKQVGQWHVLASGQERHELSTVERIWNYEAGKPDTGLVDGRTQAEMHYESILAESSNPAWDGAVMFYELGERLGKSPKTVDQERGQMQYIYYRATTLSDAIIKERDERIPSAANITTWRQQLVELQSKHPLVMKRWLSLHDRRYPKGIPPLDELLKPTSPGL